MSCNKQSMSTRKHKPSASPAADSGKLNTADVADNRAPRRNLGGLFSFALSAIRKIPYLPAQSSLSNFKTFMAVCLLRRHPKSLTNQ